MIINRIRTAIGKHLCSYVSCYLLEKDLSHKAEPLPDIPGFTLRIRQSGSLVSFDVFHVSGDLAHTTKVALKEEAKKEIDDLPYLVHFEEGEVYSGASLTYPKYRRRGLYSYTRSHVFWCLSDWGYKIDRFNVRKSNAVSLHTLQKLGTVIVGEGRYVKVLGWHNWREVRV